MNKMSLPKKKPKKVFLHGATCARMTERKGNRPKKDQKGRSETTCEERKSSSNKKEGKRQKWGGTSAGFPGRGGGSIRGAPEMKNRLKKTNRVPPKNPQKKATLFPKKKN